MCLQLLSSKNKWYVLFFLLWSSHSFISCCYQVMALSSGKTVSRILIFKPSFQTQFNFWSKSVSMSTQIRRVLSAEGNENSSIESFSFYHKNSSAVSLIQLLSHKRSSTIQLNHLRISYFFYIAHIVQSNSLQVRSMQYPFLGTSCDKRKPLFSWPFRIIYLFLHVAWPKLDLPPYENVTIWVFHSDEISSSFQFIFLHAQPELSRQCYAALCYCLSQSRTVVACSFLTI